MRAVRAGPITAVLDGAFLRRLRVGPYEVVRGVYAAVRDEHWGTIEPSFSRYELEDSGDSFKLRFTAEHMHDEIDFVWNGEYTGETSGRLIFKLEGVCRSSFRKNRIGFCILHPPDLAGNIYVRETPNGAVEERFSELISPSRDITDMQALHYLASPIGVDLRFEGDLFDMEDQRNWTDASYKTFSTPLARPFPVQVAAGERIQQTVTLELRLPTDLPQSTQSADQPDVLIRERVVGRLPPIGVGAAFDAEPLSPAAADRLRALRPSHLRVELDLRAATWRETLRVAKLDADALATGLDVAVVTDADGSGIDDVAEALGGAAVRLAAFAEQLWITTRPLVERSRRAGLRPGGGSRTDFAQLNMRQALIPFDELSFVTYAINPQVHTFDDMSIVETLGMQPVTVSSARALAGGRPIVVGPITLGPRFNPNATAPQVSQLPPSGDRRQATDFAAAWTIGSLHRLSLASPEALTYFEAAGPRGLVDAAGEPYPVYHALLAVAPFASAEILEVSLRDALTVEAIALRDRVLVANLTPESRLVSVATPSGATELELGPYGTGRVDLSGSARR